MRQKIKWVQSNLVFVILIAAAVLTAGAVKVIESGGGPK